MSPNACQFPLLFHNARHVSGITSSALAIRKLLGHEVFLNLFSFQPFEQKSMVQGLQMTKSHTERRRLLSLAMSSAFEGWNGRIREALDQAGLLNILERIKQYSPGGFRAKVPASMRELEAIETPCDAVPYLVRQAINNKGHDGVNTITITVPRRIVDSGKVDPNIVSETSDIRANSSKITESRITDWNLPNTATG